MSAFTSKTVTFPSDNKIGYWQDWSYHIGVPAGIPFSFEGFINTTIVLSAPGYGEVGNYGNGAIHLDFKSVEWKGAKIVQCENEEQISQ